MDPHGEDPRCTAQGLAFRDAVNQPNVFITHGHMDHVGTIVMHAATRCTGNDWFSRMGWVGGSVLECVRARGSSSSTRSVEQAGPAAVLREPDPHRPHSPRCVVPR